MSKNNVTRLPGEQSKKPTPSVTLESVRESIEAWRANKTRPNEPMPSAIWDDIIMLLKSGSKAQLVNALSISWGSLIREQRRREPDSTQQQTPAPEGDDGSGQDSEESIAMCEAETSYPLDCKPAKAFDTRTSVVELYRPDGMLMKIHICTERFEELLDAFFKGQS